jgi:hypothetical protein
VNRFDVFVNGTDNAMWHGWSDETGWHGWESLGGILSSAPAVASQHENQLEVFVLGNDGGLYWRRWSGTGWSAWIGFAGRWGTPPGASSQRGPLTVDVFEGGVDRALKHAVLD